MVPQRPTLQVYQCFCFENLENLTFLTTAKGSTGLCGWWICGPSGNCRSFDTMWPRQERPVLTLKEASHVLQNSNFCMDPLTHSMWKPPKASSACLTSTYYWIWSISSGRDLDWHHSCFTITASFTNSVATSWLATLKQMNAGVAHGDYNLAPLTITLPMWSCQRRFPPQLLYMCSAYLNDDWTKTSCPCMLFVKEHAFS